MPEKSVPIPLALNGLNKDLQPINLQSASPNMVNMIVDGDKIRKRLGYTRLGTTQLSGIGMQLIEWIDSVGVTHYIALTTTYAYHWSGTDWVCINKLAVAEPYAPVPFTGGAGDRWSFTTSHDATTFNSTSSAGSALIISNGKDKPFYYTGVADAVFELLGDGDFPHFVHTKEIADFWNHLFFFNHNSGDPAVQNVRSFAYSDLAAVTTWLTGTSGDGTLTDSLGVIRRALKLGTDLIIYSDGSITRCVYVGGDTLYAFPTVIYDRGLFADNAVFPANGIHYLLGSDERVYEYESSQLSSVGDAIEKSIFSAIDASKKSAIVMGHDRKNHRIYIFYPTTSDTYSCNYYCIDYRSKIKPWEFGTFNNNVRSTCTYSPSASSTSYMLFLTSDGYVYKVDESLGTDNLAIIPCEYDTPDITLDAEDNFLRISMLTINAMSTIASSTFYVYYSLDGGSTWTLVRDCANNNDYFSISSSSANTWSNHRIPVDITDRKCRFRISQQKKRTVFLAHFDGTDADTTDQIAATGQNISLEGTAQLDTTEGKFKFGTASLLLDGNSDYASVIDNDNFNFKADDFTIEAFVMFNDTTGQQEIVGQVSDYSNYWAIYKAATTHKLNFSVMSAGSNTIKYTMTSNWSVSTNTWYHIAFVRSGGDVKLFIDGVSQTLTAHYAISTKSIPDIASPLLIGFMIAGYFNGWIDEVRISTFARYTTDFSAIASAFSVEAAQDLQIRSTHCTIELQSER